MKRIVVIGGGHGQSIILQGIKDIENVQISAIVTVADSGGSTGRIRERYNIPAVGDIRSVLLSLSENELFCDLFDFRFEGKIEEDIIGHNLGNLIILALTQLTGSLEEAINVISKHMNTKGIIIPSSLEPLTLFAKMDDDTIVKGENNIPSFTNHIKEVFYDHDALANPKAIEALENADIIIYGIGSLYTSIIPNIIIKGIREAIQKSKAKKIYFANCMTQGNETFNYDLKDHVDALNKHGASIDLIIRHSEQIPEEIKERYLKENSIEVLDKENTNIKTIKRDLLDFSNNLVRHNPQKIKKVIEEIIGE